MTDKTKRIFAAFAAAALALVATPTSPAVAQPRGNVVVFGDSFTANPDQYKNTFRRIFRTSSERVIGDYPNTGNCLQSPDNWPRQLARMTGRQVADWSCAGLNSSQLPDRVERAIQDGAVNPGTETVVLSLGFNDYWPGAVAVSGTGYHQGRVQAHYVSRVRESVGKVRAVAPNARILMVGMLSISESFGGQSVCPFNVIPNMPVGAPLAPLQTWENWTRDNQRAASKAVGARFIDVKEQSKYHSTCARKDAERWVAGFVDTTTPAYNMVFHPSRAGSRHVATQVARAI